MATTALTTVSERAGQTVLSAQVVNVDSATNWVESWTLPTGFGDCFIMAVTLIASSLETIVAAGAMRGPTGFIFQPNSSTVNDIVALGEWRRQSSIIVGSQIECVRPVLWRAEEVFMMQTASEDTGAADTSDIRLVVRVARLRNQTAPMTGRAFTYPAP